MANPSEFSLYRHFYDIPEDEREECRNQVLAWKYLPVIPDLHRLIGEFLFGEVAEYPLMDAPVLRRSKRLKRN